MTALVLSVLQATLAVVRLEPAAAVPAWAWSGELCSVTRSADELSVVCGEAAVPPEVPAERDWRVLKVQGPLDFSLTGVLASLASPLALARISIFVLSTYETDYVLVLDADLAGACKVLAEVGHDIDDA